MAFTFDGTNKLVVCSTGTTSINLGDLWSRWKDWLLEGNAGYARAFDTVGGEPIDPVAGTLVPLYLFVLNGWRIRPQDTDHTLVVSGGSIVVSGGGTPFVHTVGDHQVSVLFQQPVQAMGFSTSGGTGPTAAQVADEIMARLAATTIPVDVRKINTVTLEGTGVAGDGWGPA
jgi:hypothetical protein